MRNPAAIAETTWADYLIEKLESGEQLPKTVDMEVQVLRLGGVCIVAMGGEVFVEIGLAIERALQESHRAQMALTLGLQQLGSGVRLHRQPPIRKAARNRRTSTVGSGIRRRSSRRQSSMS